MMKKVLVIDDDEGILEGFRAILESEGYDVELSADGEVLLHLSEKALPDLILLDILISGTDGRELCKILKAKPITQNIPVLMVSANIDTEAFSKGCGADD